MSDEQPKNTAVARQAEHPNLKRVNTVNVGRPPNQIRAELREGTETFRKRVSCFSRCLVPRLSPR